eukprot:TRINITY_DN55637_c0_g1_i1.p1 TRINITY_DN55637_c0_g1~~TRINITY_DN55637_c0_g1_i1.p1  ORF type:complete len:159 (-),score=10.76 TRINITY_DN55637_c0_g1_i1:62-538(-)
MRIRFHVLGDVGPDTFVFRGLVVALAFVELLFIALSAPFDWFYYVGLFNILPIIGALISVFDYPRCVFASFVIFALSSAFSFVILCLTIFFIMLRYPLALAGTDDTSVGITASLMFALAAVWGVLALGLNVACSIFARRVLHCLAETTDGEAASRLLG